MGDDAIAGSSLLQTQAGQVHREHIHKHQHNLHSGLHRRQAVAISPLAITTIAVIQQIIVDSSGRAIGTSTITATSSDSSPLPASVPAPVVAPAVVTSLAASAHLSTANVLSTGAGATGVNSVYANSVTSTPQSLSSGQASILASALPLASKSGVNTSIPTSSTGSIAPTANLVSNLTLSSTLTGLKSTSGSESDGSYSTAVYLSASGTYLTAVSSYTSSATGAAANSVAGGSTASGVSNPASTSAGAGTNGGGGGGGSGNSKTPTTPVVVGSVVGSIAGAAFVVFFLLFLLRWHKRNRSPLSSSRGDGPSIGGITSRYGEDPSQPGHMAERSIPFAIPAALATLTGRNKRASHTQSASSTAGSERGFYRVSGRKLPSVLQSGGDGYGDGFDDMPMFSNPDTLSGTSFYRDSQGFHGGPGTALHPKRDSGIPIIRPGPARTPVTQQGAFASPPSHDPFDSPPPPLRPDRLGRSHPSQDGSHGSRFTEEIV